MYFFGEFTLRHTVLYTFCINQSKHFSSLATTMFFEIIIIACYFSGPACAKPRYRDINSVQTEGQTSHPVNFHSPSELWCVFILSIALPYQHHQLHIMQTCISSSCGERDIRLTVPSVCFAAPLAVASAAWFSLDSGESSFECPVTLITAPSAGRAHESIN